MELPRARELALATMKEHGLEMFNWEFHFDNAKKRFGCCVHPHFMRKGRIQLSRYLVELNTEEEVMKTIKHEVAHALAPARAGHGPAWKRIMTDVMNLPAERCYNEAGTDRSVVLPPPKYIGTCPKGHVRGKARMPRGERSCAECCRYFNRDFLITYTLNPAIDHRG